MNNQRMADAFNSVKTVITKHSPEILTGIGIAGMITTTVLAVKATPKAVKILEEHKKNQEKISPMDVVKLTWKEYIPAVVTGTVSTACLIGASAVNLKRNAALATAYTLSETALKEYREQVIESIGDKKEQNIQEKVAEKQVIKNNVGDKPPISTGNGTTLCYDPLSGREFECSREVLERAENRINKEMLQQISGYASVNEFYDEIGLERTETGALLGWNSEHTIDLHLTAVLTKNGKPAMVVGHYNRPIYNYDH